MTRLHLIPLALLLGMIACNSSSDEKTNTTIDSSNTKMTDHSAMNNGMDLPAIPEGAKVYFGNLKDGQSVTSPVKVEFAVANLSVDSAGMVKAGSGHHHLLVDAGDSTAMGLMVAKDSTHLHFGNAQKETTLKLKPGKHRLALQFADGMHRSYGGRLANAITIEVKK